MNSTAIDQILSSDNMEQERVAVNGWVRTRRDSKAGFSFLSLADGSCFDVLQIVAANTLPNYETEILKLTAGCAVHIVGSVVASMGKGQRYEMQAEEVTVVGWVDDPETYPISPKHHSLEYLREVSHLRPRTNIIGAVTRVRHCVSQAIHRFLHDQGFYWVHTPIITSNDCEGAGELFRVSTLDLANLPHNDQGQIDFHHDFFGKETYLTVSGQLNVEAYCCALSKVYTFGPTFRAENSNTSRHLAEFWMVEPEIAFADLSDDITLAEQLLKAVIRAVLTECPRDLDFFTQRVDKTCLTRLEALAEAHFEHLDYTDAVNLLQSAKKTFEYPISWGVDLQSEHERYLTEELLKRPVVVMNYPKRIKAFYMRLNDDDKTVAAMDILVPGMGEIIGGSQREERLHVLDTRMDEMHIDKAHLSWYRDLRRYGTVPHAGFGLGLERLVSYITGVSNVRDVIPFPRTPGNASL